MAPVSCASHLRISLTAFHTNCLHMILTCLDSILYSYCSELRPVSGSVLRMLGSMHSDSPHNRSQPFCSIVFSSPSTKILGWYYSQINHRGLIALICCKDTHSVLIQITSISTPFLLAELQIAMALTFDNQEQLDRIIAQDPKVTIFLRPIAAPAALGLAGFAGSTWITASWIAGWWGNEDSPTMFFPFVAFWGGLAQFLAGLQGYAARDVLVTVIHCMWGSFWMSIGTVYLLVVSSPAVSQRII